MISIRAISAFIDVLHQATVRDIRKAGRHPVAVILLEIAQMAMLVGGFYLMNMLMKLGGGGIRGDLLLYLVTGIFFFQVHVKTVSAVLRAEGPGTQIMRHIALSPAVTILAAAFSTLYIQILAAGIAISLYHVFYTPISIESPAGLAGTFLLSWLYGFAVGLAILAIKSRAQSSASLISQAYSRINMLASGQMFVANAMPGFLMPWFVWNPLFHLIDQARGFAFVNYRPWFTGMALPVAATCAMLVLGIVLEWRSRRGLSRSEH